MTATRAASLLDFTPRMPFTSSASSRLTRILVVFPVMASSIKHIGRAPPVPRLWGHPNLAVPCFSGLAHSLGIRDVLGPSRSQLRGDEIGSGNKVDLEAALGINDSLDAPLPRRVKIDSGNLRKKIEAVGVVSEAKETAALREILRSNPVKLRSELGERRVCGLRVRGSA